MSQVELTFSTSVFCCWWTGLNTGVRAAREWERLVSLSSSSPSPVSRVKVSSHLLWIE